jgi:hypothetical protein
MAEAVPAESGLSNYLTKKLGGLAASGANVYLNTALGKRKLAKEIEKAVATEQFERPESTGIRKVVMDDPRVKQHIQRAFMDWVRKEDNAQRLIPLIPKFLMSKMRKFDLTLPQPTEVASEVQGL